MARDLTKEYPFQRILNNAYDSDGGYVYTFDAWFDIAAGRISTMSQINKFGETGANIDTADGFVDVWNGVSNANCDKNYTYSSSADIDTISSSNAGDAQDIQIQGLDANWALTTQTATLNGQSKVTLDTALIRVFRMINMGATDLAGVVYCYVDGAITAGVPDTSGDVRAIINDGDNQTLMALYTIPAGKRAFLIKGEAGLVSKLAGYIEGHFDARPFEGVFQTKRTFGLASTGSSYIDVMFPMPLVIDEKTDVRVRVNSSANDMNVNASFIMILEDK